MTIRTRASVRAGSGQARACTIAAIADQLVISERTARTHVSNILGKLGVASRTQAALLAIREGTVPVSPESFDSDRARRYGS